MVGPVEEDFLVGFCQPTICVLTPRGFVTVVWAPGSKLTVSFYSAKQIMGSDSEGHVLTLSGERK